MALEFKKQSFVIEVPTGGNPIEDWLNTHDELIDVLQCADTDLTVGRRFDCVLELLRCMMPDVDTARKMMK